MMFSIALETKDPVVQVSVLDRSDGAELDNAVDVEAPVQVEEIKSEEVVVPEKTNVDLVDDCHACKTPIGEYIVNIRGYIILCILFILQLTPVLTRFVFKSTTLATGANPGSFSGTHLNKVGYSLGFLVTIFILSSDIFEVIRLIHRLFSSDEKKLQRGHKVVDNLESIEGTGNKIILGYGLFNWTTRSLNSDDTEYSWSKWFKNATNSELSLNFIYGFRWIISGTILLVYQLYLFLNVFLDKNWTKFYHLETVHFLNGLGGPLFIALWLKVLYNFIKLIFISSNAYIKSRSDELDSNKIKADKPIYIFLKDECPCKYVVDKDSSVKKYYSNSIRFHSDFSKLCKGYFLFCSGTIVVMSAITSILTLHSAHFVST